MSDTLKLCVLTGDTHMMKRWSPLALLLSLTLVACPQPPEKTPPEIASFTATPSTLSVAGASKLEWQVKNADTLSIDNGVGAVTGSSRDLNVTATTTYTLTATNSAGSVSKAATVTVSGTPPPAAPPPFTLTKISGKIAPWTRGQRKLNASVNVQFTPYVLATGDLSSDGTFQIDLAEPPSNSLTTLVTSNCSTTLVATPANLKAVALDRFSVVTSDGRPSGMLVLTNVDPSNSSLSAAKFIAYVYADQDGTVQGTCGGGSSTSTIDLRLKRGWNTMLAERVSASELKFVTAPTPSDLSWRFAPASGGTIKIQNSVANLEVGKSVQLTATATEPDGTPITNPQLEWTSGDSNILEVTQTGLVTAKKLGYSGATISVSLKNYFGGGESVYISTYGLEATGGTFNLDGTALGTAVRLRYQAPNGSTNPVSVAYTLTGPASWNNNQPYNGTYTPSGFNGGSYGLLSEIPAVNGTYQVRVNSVNLTQAGNERRTELGFIFPTSPLRYPYAQPSAPNRVRLFGEPASSTTFTVDTSKTFQPASNFRITGYSYQDNQPVLSWERPADLDASGFDSVMYLELKDETSGQIVFSNGQASYSPTTMYGITWDNTHTYNIRLIAIKGLHLGETRASRASVTRDFKPEVTQVSVAAGAKTGGYRITITGANYDLNTSVLFGTNEATSKILSGSTSLQVIVPAGALGTVDIKLTNSRGTSVISNLTKFRYYDVKEFDTSTALRLVPSSDGTMYFLEQDAGGTSELSLSKINFAGTITRVALGAETTYSVKDVTVDSAGNVWVLFETKIIKISSSNVVTSLTLPSNSNPQMLAVSSDNKLWFTRSDANIVRMNQDGSSPTAFPLVTSDYGSSFSTSNELLLAPDNNLWFTTASGYGRVTPSGSITMLNTGYYSGGAMLLLDGALWIGSQYSTTMDKIQTSGVTTTYTNTCGGSRFTRGSDNAFWCAPNFSSNNDAALQRSILTGTTGTLSGFALPPVPAGFSSGIAEIAADSTGKIWYLRNNKIGVITP